MRIRTITYGCAYNKSDTRIIESLLEKEGHEIVETRPDLTIVNTCTVKKPTENKIIRKLEDLRGKKVLITGCLAEVKREYLKKRFPKMLLAGLKEMESIPSMIRGGKAKDGTSDKAGMEQKTKGIIRIIPLCEGCLGNCYYCATRLARGKLRSFSEKEIVKQARKSREVWITAQDTACYGLDINTDLARLLTELGKIKNTKVRVGMMNPAHAKKFLPELIESFKSESIFKFLHVPVQSGSDKLLKEMNRGYSAREFEMIVKEFREAYPRITISTDVITGYPTETEQDSGKTMELIKRVRPDVLNISMYWEMDGTKAAEMKQLPNGVRKERSRKLTKLFHSISLEKNREWVGWEGEVLIDEIGKKGVVGRNYAYKPVVIKEGKLGETVRVRIIDARTHYLLGEII